MNLLKRLPPPLALSESNGSNKKNDAPTVTTRPISDGKQTYSFSISARDAQNGWGESISKQSETSQHEDFCLKTIATTIYHPHKLTEGFARCLRCELRHSYFYEPICTL